MTKERVTGTITFDQWTAAKMLQALSGEKPDWGYDMNVIQHELQRIVWQSERGEK